ncbi:MAG: hypothetical protein ACI35O_04015 [Bacillaceae bacterium]
MNKKDRVDSFLKELNELTKKYDLEITAEGTSPLLYDTANGEYAAEFGTGFLGGEYKVYQYD